MSEGAQGFEAFGLSPTGIDAVIPTYLYRYRRNGQFADVSGAAVAASAGQT